MIHVSDGLRKALSLLPLEETKETILEYANNSKDFAISTCHRIVCDIDTFIAASESYKELCEDLFLESGINLAEDIRLLQEEKLALLEVIKELELVEEVIADGLRDKYGVFRLSDNVVSTFKELGLSASHLNILYSCESKESMLEALTTGLEGTMSLVNASSVIRTEPVLEVAKGLIDVSRKAIDEVKAAIEKDKEVERS